MTEKEIVERITDYLMEYQRLSKSGQKLLLYLLHSWNIVCHGDIQILAERIGKSRPTIQRQLKRIQRSKVLTRGITFRIRAYSKGKEKSATLSLNPSHIETDRR